MIVLNNFKTDARVRKEAKSLAADGHRVTVLALKDKSVPAEEEADGFRVVRVQLKTRGWGLGVVARSIKLLEYLARTLREALSTRSDVYHAHDGNTLLVSWLAARLRGARLVYDAHEFERGRNWATSNLPFIFRRLWTLSEQLLIGRADLVLTVSQSIADALSKTYRIDCPTVILNSPEYVSPSASNRLREELGIPSRKRIVLYQGGIMANRGLYSLVAGAMRVSDTVVTLLGNGHLLNPLRSWVQASGWEDRVYFVGLVPWEDLPSYSASADVGVALIQNACLSYHYSLPNKLFEYIHAGLPIVASDLPEIRQVVQRFQIGLVVDPESPEAVAEAIRTILDDSGMRRRMRTNAQAASRILNWQNEASKLLQAYRKLAS